MRLGFGCVAKRADDRMLLFGGITNARQFYPPFLFSFPLCDVLNIWWIWGGIKWPATNISPQRIRRSIRYLRARHESQYEHTNRVATARALPSLRAMSQLWFSHCFFLRQELTRKEFRPFRDLLKADKRLRLCGKRLHLHCDADNNKRISREEWSVCVGLKQGTNCGTCTLSQSLKYWISRAEEERFFLIGQRAKKVLLNELKNVHCRWLQLLLLRWELRLLGFWLRLASLWLVYTCSSLDSNTLFERMQHDLLTPALFVMHDVVNQINPANKVAYKVLLLYPKATHQQTHPYSISLLEL